MLDSGSTVQLDAARFAAGSHALGDRVTDLAARRAEVEVIVGELLQGWHGEAATTFRDHWEAWRDGADLVIDALRRDVASLPLTAADLGCGDAQSAQASARLSGRLG